MSETVRPREPELAALTRVVVAVGTRSLPRAGCKDVSAVLEESIDLV